jgi:hypothetical protein
LEFETAVGEDPAEYISNIQVIQPVCPSTGDIRFEVSSSTGGPFEITVTHPNGVDVFTVPEGLVSLAEHIDITNGDYNIEVSDVNAGPDCVDAFDATIEGAVSIQIEVEAIIPPSEPSSMDGAIVVVITMPGEAPYEILLNGLPWGLTTETTFTIEGLGAGDYTVQVRDVNGCESNILFVTVPLFGSLGLELGFGFAAMPLNPALIPEQSHTEYEQGVTSFVDVGLHYRMGGIKQEGRIMMFEKLTPGPSLKKRGEIGCRISQIVEIWRWDIKDIEVRALGGLSVDMIRGDVMNRSWEVGGVASWGGGKFGRMEMVMRVRGWARIEGVEMGVGVRMGWGGKEGDARYYP